MLHHNYSTTLQLHHTTLHPAVVGEVIDQVNTATTETIWNQSNHPSVHQWICFAIHGSQHCVSFFETSATALCGATGIWIYWNIYIYIKLWTAAWNQIWKKCEHTYMILWTLEINGNLDSISHQTQPTVLMNRQVKPFCPTPHHDAGVEVVHEICHNSCKPQRLAAHPLNHCVGVKFGQMPSDSIWKHEIRKFWSWPVVLPQPEGAALVYCSVNPAIWGVLPYLVYWLLVDLQ